MAEEKKKMGFFKRILTSIKDFDKYQVFALENIGKAIGYLVKIMLIFTALISITFTYQFSVTLKDAIGYMKQNIQQLEYAEGKLMVNNNEPMILENDKSVIQTIIVATGETTQEQQNQYASMIEKYPNGIILYEDKIVVKTQMLTQKTEYEYEGLAKSYGISEFNKQDMMNFITNINLVSLYAAFFLTVMLYLFMVYFISTIIDVIMLAVLGFIVARIAGMKIRLKATFNMGIYALTLPIILNLIYIVVNNFTGFTIQYFQWMYTTISYIYIIVAILMIKTDLVNRQIEVMKIQEEQERVKAELEQQKEQEKQGEEQQENKETKKEEPKEEKKEKNLGEEPEGV